jgi:hypothetical protein
VRAFVLVTAVVATAGCLAAGTANAATDNGVSATKALTQQVHALRQGISWHRSMTWRYQDRAGVPRTRSAYAERHTRSVPYLTWINRRWWSRQIQAKHLRVHHAAVGGIAHLALWLCIHRGEGAWNANTGNGYYGGLQMTAGWYGGSGHLASSDPPAVQMAAAEAGLQAAIRQGREYSWLSGQWPNTSPPCLGYA